jgi:hypothetical protein
MFVEGEVEVKIKDRAAQALDEHNLKIWLQRAFKDMRCYRISDFNREDTRTLHAVVALKLDGLPDDERVMIETHPNDVGLLRSFIERMFEGKGQIRCVGDPKLRTN